MLLLFVIVAACVNVIGAVEGNDKALAPVREMLPPIEMALVLVEMIRLVRGAEFPTVLPKATVLVPGVRVNE